MNERTSMNDEATLAALLAVDAKLWSFYGHAAKHRDDPPCAAVLLRCFAERLVALVLGRGKPTSRNDTLDRRMRSPEFLQQVPHSGVRGMFDQLRTTGNDGAHGREVTDSTCLFECAQALTQWYVEHAGVATPGSHPPTHLGASSWRDFEAPRWQRRLSGSPSAPRLFLVRTRDKTTVLHEHDGIVEARWDQMPTLLFGAGHHLWEQEATVARVLVAAMDLGEYWEAPESAPVPLAYLPCAGLQAVNLATGETHAVDPFGDMRWTPGSPHLPPLDLSRESRSLVAVGPWYLSLDAIYGFSGGAHGDRACVFDAFDTSGSSAEFPLLTLVQELDRQHPELRQQALTAWAEEGDWNDDEDSPELTIHRFEFTFAEGGQLGLSIDYTGETCYAATDGRWDSYTRSVTIHTSSLPPELQAYAEMPEAVSAWFNGNRDDFGGWTELDVTVLPLLTARFDGYR
jgi:hypothetical protein